MGELIREDQRLSIEYRWIWLWTLYLLPWFICKLV